MASRSLNHLHPTLHPITEEFMRRCNEAGAKATGRWHVAITCTYRSPEEQNQLYAQGRSHPGKVVTHLRGGASAHNHRDGDRPAALAFDFVPILEHGPGMADDEADWSGNDEAWEACFAHGRALGLDLGADWKGFKDRPHAQLRNWREIA
jgi:peptidoglycan L-alanyl-D-glutamate endopeptidase CwlK